MRNRKKKTVLNQESKERFLEDISREIHRPLQTMMEMNENILLEYPDEKIFAYAQEIQSAERVLSSLMDDMLNFSRMELGILRMKKEIYRLRPLLEEASRILKSEAEKKGITVRLNVEEDLPAVLRGDERKVRQLLMHLIFYSIRHTGEGKITFSAQKVWSDRGRFALKLTIADTGDGIGLEEDILKYLVEQLGGEVRIQGVPEKGAMICVRVPHEVPGTEETERFLAEHPASDGQMMEEKQSKEKPFIEKTSENVKTPELEMPETEEILIDQSTGIAYCDGSREMYLDILETYVEQGEKYCRDMARYQEKKDWKNYQVLVHAIKSNSRSIGAKELSREAEMQEMAAKEKNESLMRDGWESLCRNYQRVLKEAADLLEEEKQEESDQKETPAEVISEEQYLRECQELLEYVRAYEMNEVMGQIKAMKKIRLEGDRQQEHMEIINRIQDAVDGFDYDGAEECLSEWMKTQEAKV